MDTLKKTLFILAFITLITQTVRHGYYRWLEPGDSVLDKYNAAVEDDIRTAESLDQLLKLYDDAHQKVVAAKDDPAIKDIPRYERGDIEPFKTEERLRNAIEGWESRSRDINRIRFYSGIGLAFVILGVVVYRRYNQWLGLTLIIAGFAEKIYWSSPTFIGDTTEYARLLTNKFVISALALTVLLLVAWLTDTISSKRQTA